MGLPIASELVTILTSNPILAWFTVLFVLGTDTFLTGLAFDEGTGVAGFIISSVLQGIGINIPITSFNILVVVAVSPLFIFALRKSGT